MLDSSRTQGQANGPKLNDDSKPKIRTLASLGPSRDDEANWRRHAQLTGQGATHVKSFHCKLQGDGLKHLDQQINDWLETHEDCEVKFVTTSVGEWTDNLGKASHLIVQVWV
ncbi:MAG: hypothetical protein KatS3mg103_1152 [Phycisphaerales bacterium]|nr:MAG: hypothetical protein KatS3mg103_1152 [Phycisphaerales bacterium]